MVDDSYVADSQMSDFVDEGDVLDRGRITGSTDESHGIGIDRRPAQTIRNRIIVYGVLFMIIFRMALDSLGVVFWETWIAQAINQNLRVKMIGMPNICH